MSTLTPTHHRPGTSGRPLLRGARGLASVALSAAAGAHLAQAARHLADGSFHGRLHAGFFLAAGLFQLFSIAGLVAGRGELLVIVGNLAIAVLWAASVTTGLPASLSPGGSEPVTLAGAVAAALGVLAVSALIGVRSRSRRSAPPAASRPQRRYLGPPSALTCTALVAAGWMLPVSADSHNHGGGEHASGAHDALHLDGVHLHGLGGDPPDPGPDPTRQARGPLAGVRVPVGSRPAALAADGHVLWVADREAGMVHRLDARTGRPLGAPARVGIHPIGVAVGAGAVWVTNAGSNSVSRLDQTTGEEVGRIPVGKVPVGVAIGAGSVWVTNSAEGTVSRIDPETGSVSTTDRIGYGPVAVAVAAGRPWVVNALDRAVVSLDGATGEVLTETPVDAGPASIVFGHGSLWVASSSAGTVTRLDPSTGSPVGAPIVVDARTKPGQGPAALAAGSRIAVLNNHDKTIVSIDPASLAVSEPRFLDRRVARHITPASLALTDTGELWATELEGGAVIRTTA